MSIPPHNAGLVQELKGFLAEMKAAIRTTEDRLRILNEEVQSLEAVIDSTTNFDANSRCTPHHQFLASNTAKGKHTSPGPFPPIHKCPTEILCMIFDFSLIHDHTRIRELLLVCKRWNYLIMRTPKMWTHIQFKVTDVLSPKIGIYHRYLDACMARSWPLLLNIEIDVEEFRTLEDYLREEVMERMKVVVDKEDWDAIYDWGSGFECDFSSAKFEVNFEEIWSLLRSLTGEAGKHMSRWQSLSLSLPECWLACNIWELFEGATPYLSQLEISGIDDIFDIIDEPLSSFPVLTSLRSLVILDSCDASVLDICPDELEQLQIPFNYNFSFIRPLSRFISLQFLVLKSSDTYIHHPSEPFTISLPCLTSLTLLGRWGGLETIQFSLPSHEILNLESASASGFDDLPVLSPRIVRWKIYMGRDEGWSCLAIQSAITSAIYASKQIETLLIHESATKALIKILSYLEESHLLPRTLRSVKSVDDYGGMSENLLSFVLKGRDCIE